MTTVFHTGRARLERYFRFKERNTKWVKEIRGGFVTFVTLAYILSVNASILADCGGTCVDIVSTDNPFDDPAYFDCLDEIKLDLIGVTALSSFIGTFIMGAFANLPIALAPGLGTNAFFSYTVVGFAGSGPVSYQTALCATFIEGWIFVLISLTGVRKYIAKVIPSYIKHAMAVGIGLFLAHIGLQSSEGIGLIVADGATKVTLGGCGHSNEVCVDELAGLYCGCSGDDEMLGGTTWLGILGFCIISVLMINKVKGSVIIGILFVAFISWFRNTSVTYFPNNATGDARFAYFKEVADAHGISDKTAFVLFDEVDFGSSDVWVALFTFLYVDLLDTTGTLYSMAEFAGIMKDNGEFEGQTAAFCADAFATVAGALLGTSTVTSYIESGAGIREGGVTGASAIVTSLFFLVSLLFAPILASVPPWSTGPALIVVGCLMTKSVVKIDWANMRHAFPCFVCIILMPLTYSIAYGIIGGGFVSFVIWLCDQFLERVWRKYVTPKCCACWKDSMADDGITGEHTEQSVGKKDENALVSTIDSIDPDENVTTAGIDTDLVVENTAIEITSRSPSPETAHTVDSQETEEPAGAQATDGAGNEDEEDEQP